MTTKAFQDGAKDSEAQQPHRQAHRGANGRDQDRRQHDEGDEDGCPKHHTSVYYGT